MNKPKILVARAIFPEIIAKLEQYFDVTPNLADELWSKAQLITQLQGKQGVFTAAREPIDAEVLSACPDLKICANMAVGYNNFDVPAMTAASVIATTGGKHALLSLQFADKLNFGPDLIARVWRDIEILLKPGNNLRKNGACNQNFRFVHGVLVNPDKGHDDEKRNQNAKRPSHIAKKTGHFHTPVFCHSLDHQVRCVTNVGVSTHKHRTG